MNNQEHLSEIVNEINDILGKHNAQAYDIPESLMVYVIINNDPEMIEAFLEDGFVALPSDQRFGWMQFAK